MQFSEWLSPDCSIQIINMKKFSILLIIAGLFYLPAHACDICGCGVSNYNPFLFPHLSRSYVSLSYIHRSYRTASHTAEGEQDYTTMMLAAQYSLTKRIQLLTMLQFGVNNYISDGTKRKLNGLGDASIMFNYTAWEKMTKICRQTFVLGGGFKLPSGKYQAAKSSAIEENIFQLGTGSTDFIFNTSYRASFRKWMVSVAGTYKYNTQNKDDYRFGDVLTSGTTLAYKQEFDGISLMPYLAVTNEWQYRDADNHVLQNASGGNVLYTGAGIDVNTKKLAAGFNYQFAASQNLAGGVLQAKPRLTAHISFTL